MTSIIIPTFKINYIDKNEIKKVYAFVGSEMINKHNLTELFERDKENDIFKSIFSQDEITIIIEKGIPVKFCNEAIYTDDTIETIKKKIISEFDVKISFEEIYLFYKSSEIFDTLSIYKKLTQNEKIQLNKEILIDFLLNFDDIDISSIPDKEIYNYDDFLSLKLDKEIYLVNKPLGQILAAINYVSTFIANPFYIEEYNTILDDIDKVVSTTNERLLLNYKNINMNIIYLCLAKDTFNYNIENNISQEITSKLYFPFLFSKNITNLQLLEDKTQELLSNTKKIIDKNFIKKIKNVELFYNIYSERINELNIISTGIKSIQFIIHPKISVRLPIDTIFKQIHATETIPIIKYNPSARQENIYRLYSDKISIDGKKIPYLNKGIIFKLIKQIGKNTGISLVVQRIYEGVSINFECDIEVNGDITIKTTFNQLLDINEISELVKETINPIILLIKNILEQSEDLLNTFDNFNNNNIEIIDINYQLIFPIKSKINLKKYIGCLSSIFAIYESNPDKGVEMRYKRVAQYSEVDSQTALVIELINKGYDKNEIISELKENFNLTDEETALKLTSILEDIESKLKVYKNKRLKVDTNPGFLTTISLEQFTNNAIINVFGINDIQYLYPLSVYINSLIRMTQYPETTSISSDIINNICKGKAASDEKKIQDVVVEPEELPYQQAQAIAFDTPPIEVPIVDENVIQAPKANILDFLYEEEEEEEEMVGGARGDSSEDGNDDEDEINPEIPQATLEETNINIDLGNRPEKEIITTPVNEGADITGMTLNKPNPFFRKLESYEPTLFLTNVDKEFKAYSRACPYNNRRQPVLLTDEEKERIDLEHPGSYTEAIKYGSNPDKKYWYICPRYWDLKRNVSLTEKEAKSGKYGKIIPFKSNKIPKDANIYEFTDDKYHKDKNDKYINLHPGFLKEKVHPEGLCVPCCFKNWGAPEQKKRRDQCLRKDTEKEKEQPREREIETEQYIKGPEKFPLEPGRWGYLPIAVQKFLRTDNKKCYISNTNTNLKPNIECLLRHGVEINRNQSFIGCIADLFVEETESRSILSIKQMKQKIIEAIDLDLFITLQNGNLVNIFENKDIDIIIGNYRKTNIYKKLDMRNSDDLLFIKRAASAYETFIQYLNDDDVVLDHKYLWDIISIPNPKLFKKGINLIILNLERNDITDNISVLCPSNHYSGEFFNTNKYSLILLKTENFYEPIYTLEDKVKEWSIKRVFNLKDKSLLPNLRNSLELIKSTLKDKCTPLNSIPTVYKFKTNIILSELLKLLNKVNYDVLYQVINYNNKVIGVISKNKDNVECFVPCYPSSSIKELAIKTMDEDIWNDFQTTLDYLVELSNISSKKILCLPKIKVLEDGLIVGIITETNQFISITNPEQNTMALEMPTIESSDYNDADIKIMTKQTIDDDRVKYIKYIKLETGFYNSFRNTVRILLGQYKNRNIKNEIEDIIKSKKLLYVNKLKKIIEKLNKISRKYIDFIDYSDEELNDIDEVSYCLLSEECNTKTYCQQDNNVCKIKITKTNLINKLDNEEIYFGKLADELVRYNRINSFILQNNSLPLYRNVKYNINKDEIIILQSLLTQDYFDSLVYEKENKYIQHNTYDNAKPSISVSYSNVIDRLLNNEPAIKYDEVTCELEKTNGVGGKLKKLFPKDTIELIFGTTPELCSFSVIETIINDNAGEIIVNKMKLKQDLIEEYEKYKDYLYEIIDILVKQGKSFANQVIVGQLTMADMIMSDNYFATNLDIWILSKKYNIPLIFLSGTTLMENNKFILVANTDGSDKFYFIKSPGIGVLKVPKYRLFIHKTAKFSVSNFDVETQDLIRSQENYISLNDFIEQFSEKKIRQPKKAKKKLKLVLEEEAEQPKTKAKKVKKKNKLVLVE